MLSLLLIFVCNVLLNQAAILQCDFEILCDDFISDSNWGLTNGLHPQPIDYDHTLNTSSGHYLFYNPQPNSQFEIAEIKTTNWVQPSINRSVCFQMWYYTPRLNLPFNIELIQGSDEQLTRIVASITGKDPSINDWTLINIKLPNEKIKIFIRLNVSIKPLAFDDICVDYCDEPYPSPSKVLFSCDFESSCSNDFVSLPKYPYQWSIFEASNAIQIEESAPSIDYTFGNSSGHYALLLHSKMREKGNVGYFHLQKQFEITSEESYCLNFYYYTSEISYWGNLKVYTMVSDQSQTIQLLWPRTTFGQYLPKTHDWTWGIINLPVGNYSILFRVESTTSYPFSFGLDNIDIMSCDYPTSELSPDKSLLSFSCNFDNLTMCNMTNDNRFSTTTVNFTVLTGDTIPNVGYGPDRDHTTNSSTGGFLYWNRQLSFNRNDVGRVNTPIKIEQNFGMCLQFSYYVKSFVVNKKGTKLTISSGGCYASTLWYQALDDSQGWQTAVIRLLEFACAETFYFDVAQSELIKVSVAFDDIQIDQCSSLIPTTTSTSTTTETIPTYGTTSTTTTTTPVACGNVRPNTINVVYRTSTMFTGLITYNCSFINWINLTVLYDDESAKCSVSDHFPYDAESNNTISVTCENIRNNAGHDWNFNIYRTSSFSGTFIKDAFTITLQPLPLNGSINMSIDVHRNLTSASVFVSNCKNISQLKYLVFRCNNSDKSYNTLLDNCTYTCFNLEPGSIYHSSLVRLPIRIADKTDDIDNTFPEDNLNEIYRTGGNIRLDKVTNLTFIGNLTENRTAYIHFIRPRGYYDVIRFDCYKQDQHCWIQDYNLTNSVGNCSDCNSISIFQVIHGVKYICQALTIKQNFTNETSGQYSFYTNLKPVLYDGLNSSSTSLITFNVIRQSDFEHIVSTCTVVDNPSSPCSNLIVRDDNCSTTLKLNGTLGCNYKCSFTTEKTNYTNVISDATTMTIYPPKPMITNSEKGSRWINITWMIDEISYIQSFYMFKNNTFVGNLNQSDLLLNKRVFSYKYTEDIKPFSSYELYVQLDSNHKVSSERIVVKTLEEAPERPSDDQVQSKILPQSDNEASIPTQYVVNIDLSLFSNDYGILHKYFIYVRQDQMNNMTQINFNGTYADAYQNSSIDYLAVEITMIDSEMDYLAMTNVSYLSVTLGNESECANDLVRYSPCNGPLRPSTLYKVIVAGCTNAGCTNVLSKPFKTRNSALPSPGQDSSKAWIVIFPLLAITIIVAVLATWKRRQLKLLIGKRIRKLKSRPS